MEANGPTSIAEPEAVAAARPSLLDRADGVAAAESLPTADGRATAPVRRTPQVRRTGIVLKPNNSRVVIRPFELQNESRIERIVARVMSLSEPEVEVQVDDLM